MSTTRAFKRAQRSSNYFKGLIAVAISFAVTLSPALSQVETSPVRGHAVPIAPAKNQSEVSRQAEKSGLPVYVLEAENAKKSAVKRGRWAAISGSDMSNGSGAHLDMSGFVFSNSGDGPSLSWSLSSASGGDFEVWARLRSDDGDSLFLDIDGSTVARHFPVSKHWLWHKLKLVSLSAGRQHKLTVYARERMLEIDKLIVQASGSAAPVSMGPLESTPLRSVPTKAALIQLEQKVRESTKKISSGSSGGSGVFVQTADKLVSLEAESGVRTSANGSWKLVEEKSYSNGSALSLETAVERVKFGEGARIKWKVKAKFSGKYKIWSLIRNENGNSVYSDFDGDFGYQYFIDSSDWSWRVFANRSVNLVAGKQHTLQILARDEGIDIDKLMLIPVGSDYKPSGVGLVESAREGNVYSAVEKSRKSVGPQLVKGVGAHAGSGSVDTEKTEPLKAIKVSGAENSGVFNQSADKIVSLEAENAEKTNLGGSWEMIDGSQYSNGKALELNGFAERVKYGKGPSLKWIVKAKYSGNYKIKALMRNSGANSVYSNLDGNSGYQYFFSSNKLSWRLFWNRRIVMVAGEEHTLEIWARDPGVVIDKVVLIPEKSHYAPSGEGPVQSARGSELVETVVEAKKVVEVKERIESASTQGAAESGKVIESFTEETTDAFMNELVASYAEPEVQSVAKVKSVVTPDTDSRVDRAPSPSALLGALNAINDHYPGTKNYGKKVTMPSCDGADALRISTVAGLKQINNSSYRVFCIAPGDYRSHGLLAISGTGGTENAPKVIRFESSEFADSDEIFKSNLAKVARMPAIDIRNTSHWVLNRLVWEGTSGLPIRLAGASNIIIDRVRLTKNLKGIEFQHGANDSYVQNSYIGDQIIPQYNGNDGVCIAMVGHYWQPRLGGNITYDYPVVSRDNYIVNNEIFNCNDGFQAVWMKQYDNQPDFQGTILAGNDIYIDSTRRTNCSGTLNPIGDCAYTENAMDFKAASLNAANPVEIFDNRMWGWRKTDSVYNRPANSWGTAISTHFTSMRNLHIYENVFWDVGAGVGFTRGSRDSVVRDNIFANVTGAGINNGVVIMTYSDSYEYGHSHLHTGNVKNMTVERNHVINVTDGGKWLSTSAENSKFECNVIVRGSWTATNGNWNVGLTAGRNTYYGTNSGALSRGSDAVHSAGTSNMGELCFDTRKASIDGGVEVCLAGVLDRPASPNVCASAYWSTDNWPRN